MWVLLTTACVVPPVAAAAAPCGCSIFARWEHQIGLSYSTMSLFKFVVGMLFAAHWVCCRFAVSGACVRVGARRAAVGGAACDNPRLQLCSLRLPGCVVVEGSGAAGSGLR